MKKPTKQVKRRALPPPGFNPRVFANRVRDLISETGLPLIVVAERAHVDRGVLSRIGTNDTIEPRLPTIWNLADFFGVSLDYLTGRRDEVAPELVAVWQKLSAAQRDELVQTAKALRRKRA